MKFSIPIDIGFEVLNKFIKEGILYKKSESEDESAIFNIDIDVDDEFSARAGEIINSITGGQKTRSQQWDRQE